MLDKHYSTSDLLRLNFHDTHEASHPEAPGLGHIHQLIQWLSKSSGISSLLVHCQGGRGRSPAIAAIALSYLHRGISSGEVFKHVLAGCESVDLIPNVLIAKLGDLYLGDTCLKDTTLAFREARGDISAAGI